MNINRGLSIYQAYSLSKISALNKKSLAVQYAQCEQLNKLEQQLSRELRAANRINQQILENQLNEIRQREILKFYKKVAHNAKEIVEIFNSQHDLLFRKFLIEVFAQPAKLMLQDAKNNLEEINDIEYCSLWLRMLDECVSQLKQIDKQYIQSEYYTFLVNEASFFSQRDELEMQSKKISRP